MARTATPPTRRRRAGASTMSAPGDLRWETRLLLVVTAVLVVFGIANMYSASIYVAAGETGSSLMVRQLLGAVAGGIVLTIIARLDYHLWQRFAWEFLVVAVVLLVIPILPFTHGIAPIRNGARRWIEMGPLNLQPSEVAKLAVLVWCAMLATKKGDLVRQFRVGVLPFLVIIGSVSFLILLEPNLSMATLVALLGGVVLFAAGAKIGQFLLLGIAGVLLVIQQILNADYRMARALSFLNPGDAGAAATHQASQSLIGLGSGQLFGVGFGEGHQKLGFLPYAHSDFLFGTIGEEWGFVGVLFTVLCYALFLWLGFRIARTAADRFGSLLATGLTATVGLGAFLHMGVTLALLPTTGLPLPFMSYGRTNLIMALVGTGILVSIGRQRAPARR